jgi:UDP-N-acetylmuramoylalanine--D-glutamate ligase
MIQVKEKMNIIPNSLNDKKVLVVGLARSGTGAANLLSSIGAEVTVTDRKPSNSLKSEIKKLSPVVKFVSGENTEGLFSGADLIVVSPGVPLDIPQIEVAVSRGIPVIGELELAYQVAAGYGAVDDENSEHGTPPFIGITGTNGKSTTATLVDLMLKMSGFRTLLCGNIGRALTEEINKLGFTSDGPVLTGVDRIVAEVSSFQLESIIEFRPKVAAVLNITPDHLDRYRSMDEYTGAKAKIFENQGEGDRLVLNADDLLVMDMLKTGRGIHDGLMPDIYFFSRSREVEGVYLKNGVIYCNLSHTTSIPSHFPIMTTDEVRIRGLHNLENAMAASLISILAGSRPEDVRQVLMDFPGLEHRLEVAGEYRGVIFINDSKGTNVGAVMKSLESFENLILIMGGMDKGSDFTVLRDLVESRVKTLILIGEAKEKIAREIGNSTETILAADMYDAVRISVSRVSGGDVVMLSPGCASFDMFDDFEDRGRSFKEAVRKVAG